MKMKDVSEGIIEKKIEEEFHICENCGYRLGFHVSFQKKADFFEVILICPNCGQRHRVNWFVNLA